MKRRYSPEARRAHLRAMHQATVQPEPVGLCPRCNGRLFWTDEDHDAVRCSACQHLMVAAKNIRAASERMKTEQQPDPIKKLVEAYQGDFLTAVELADLILQTLPQPEAERVTATIEAAHQRALREQPKPEEDDDGLPLPAPKHADDCRCHLCWAASLTPPSPPWEGGAA